MVTLTPKQVKAIEARLTASCTDVQVDLWDRRKGRTISVSQFQRQRLIETTKIGPSGTVKVLA